ncbi:pirin family protein [Flammeovirga sp. SJP92]|uniref:pirin family protein n=1 Tax=Flammeovirga sp. SJP92 TaxID=1775430 RepID=UPI000786E9C7|nr:pirin family protein [Flammeovirga sp. SJP92]KXX72626.1 hypothetical protein AVL50_06390 [Flammeovirga sp. SJP92]
MELNIKKRSQQHAVALFGGKLHENKPLAGDPLYSNLIYWAHVEANEEGTFPMHPHKGIEILTFIFEGGLEHFDTATNKWTPLPGGGVQQIYAGNGVYHSEKYLKGSRAFQIWFDPDFSKSLTQKASYRDFQSNEFSWTTENGLEVMNYAGQAGPIQTNAPEVEIKRYKLPKGEGEFDLDPSKVYSIYLMDGAVKVAGKLMEKDAFVKVEGQELLTWKALEEAELFILSSPVNVGYKTAY